MSVSLKNQVLHAISKSKSFGTDKHALKGKGQHIKAIKAVKYIVTVHLEQGKMSQKISVII